MVMQMQAVPRFDQLVCNGRFLQVVFIFQPYLPAINRPLRSISGGCVVAVVLDWAHTLEVVGVLLYAWVYAWRRPCVSWIKFQNVCSGICFLIPLRSIMLRNRCISSSWLSVLFSAGSRISSLASQSFQKSCALAMCSVRAALPHDHAAVLLD